MGKAKANWLLFVPLSDLHFVLVPLLRRGECGPNRYGSAPLAATGTATGDLS